MDAANKKELFRLVFFHLLNKTESKNSILGKKNDNFYISRNTFCCYVTPDEKTPIEDGSYDVLLCSAGMFPGKKAHFGLTCYLPHWGA